MRAHVVSPALLDGALQVIPHDAIESWWPGHGGDVIAYPHQVEALEVFGPTPAGEAVCRSVVKFVGGEGRFARFLLQIFEGDRLWAQMKLTEVLLPKGPLGRLPGDVRRGFIRDQLADESAHLGQGDAKHWVVEKRDVVASNWFAGTLEQVYRAHDVSDVADLTRVIAIKEAVGRAHGLHPSSVSVSPQGMAGFYEMPGVCVRLEVTQTEATEVVVTGDPSRLRVQVDEVGQWWQHRLGLEQSGQPGQETWFGNDLYGGMLGRFVGEVVCEDLAALMALRGQSVLFLGNHETQIESLLITILASVLTDTTVITMANAKHESGWVGELVRDLFSYPGLRDPENIVYFRQTDRESMFTLLDALRARVSGEQASLMVHAPGTRATAPREPVTRLSSVFLDLAVELKMPIVPLGFSRGLPAGGVTEKQEFPWQQGAQCYAIGAPIGADELAALPYATRRTRVLEAINRQLLDPDPVAQGVTRLDREVKALHNRGVDHINATLWSVLHGLEHPGADVQMILGHDAPGRTPVSMWLRNLRVKRWPSLG